MSAIQYEETIKLTSSVNQGTLPDITIDVYVNGVYDPRSDKHYKAVKIGTQIWLAENLNFGERMKIERMVSDSMTNNGIPEKYCYDNLESNCDTYGGMYMWNEMMQYNPPDTGLTGTTQGVCMDGWHIPTKIEWETLIYFLDGYKTGNNYYKDAGGKLKEAGTSHWIITNVGTTNESGFTALPGGELGINNENDINNWYFWFQRKQGNWWFSTKGSAMGMGNGNDIQSFYINHSAWAISVRCVKNPGK